MYRDRKEQAIRTWCARNGYVLVKIYNTKENHFKSVIDTVNLIIGYDCRKKSKKRYHTFAKYIAIDYLRRFYTILDVCNEFNVSDEIGRRAKQTLKDLNNNETCFYEEWEILLYNNFYKCIQQIEQKYNIS